MAARAIKAGEFSAKGFAEYDRLRAREISALWLKACRDQMRKRGFTVSDDWRAMNALPPDEVEKVMVEVGQAVAVPPRPLWMMSR